ncbi:hypothetical protein NADFUDRAFT_40134 [Nadsonia fulvescens var. elongata DSM 6958]|uniref:Uncharacterized protein n=1 Tax=Nadsonia fulvescens var. elongata DSM 6958 TaxID=857566 RepID=A0A1E3PNS8_9ASCO|nr:hypothetical protein NADFUDRAFT_40134 [Nadsonia fulvescens var. elongata DSM 6958]
MSPRRDSWNTDYISASESDEEAFEIIGFNRLIQPIHSVRYELTNANTQLAYPGSRTDNNELIKIKKENSDLEAYKPYSSLGLASQTGPSEATRVPIQKSVLKELVNSGATQVGNNKFDSFSPISGGLIENHLEIVGSGMPSETVFSDGMINLLEITSPEKFGQFSQSQVNIATLESLPEVPNSMFENQLEDSGYDSFIGKDIHDVMISSGRVALHGPSEYSNKTLTPTKISKSPPHASEYVMEGSFEGIQNGHHGGKKLSGLEKPSAAFISDSVNFCEDSSTVGMPKSHTHDNVIKNQSVTSAISHSGLQVSDYNIETVPSRHLRPRTSKQKYPYSFDYYKYKSLGMAGVVGHSWRANREGYEEEKTASNGLDIDLVFAESPDLSGGGDSTIGSQNNPDSSIHHTYRYKRNIVSSDDDSEYNLSTLKAVGEDYLSSDPDTSEFNSSDAKVDYDNVEHRKESVHHSRSEDSDHSIGDIIPPVNLNHQNRMSRLLRGILPASYLASATRQPKVPVRSKKRKSLAKSGTYTRGKAIRKIGLHSVEKSFDNNFNMGNNFHLMEASTNEEQNVFSSGPSNPFPQGRLRYKPSKKIPDFFPYKFTEELGNVSSNVEVEDKIDRMLSISQSKRVRLLKKNDTTKSKSKIYHNLRTHSLTKRYTTRRRQGSSLGTYHKSADNNILSFLPSRRAAAVTVGTTEPRAYNPVKYISFGSRKDDIDVIRRSEGFYSELNRLELLFSSDFPQHSRSSTSGVPSVDRAKETSAADKLSKKMTKRKKSNVLAIIPSVHKPVNRVKIRPGNLEIMSNKYVLRPPKKIRQSRLAVTPIPHMLSPSIARQNSFLTDEQRYQAIADAENQNQCSNPSDGTMRERLSKCYDYLKLRKKSNPSVYIEDNTTNISNCYNDSDINNAEVVTYSEDEDDRGNFYESPTMVDLERIRHLPRSFKTVLRTIFGIDTIDYLLSTMGHIPNDPHTTISTRSMGEILTNYKADIEYWNIPHRFGTEYGELQNLHLRDLKLVTDIVRNSVICSEPSDSFTSILANIVSFTSSLSAVMLKEAHKIFSQGDSILSRMIIQGLKFCLIWLCLLRSKGAESVASGIFLVIKDKFFELSTAVLKLLTRYSVDTIIKHLSYDRVKEDEWGLEMINAESPYVILLYTAIFVNTFDFETGCRNANQFWKLPIFLQSDITAREGDNLTRLVFCCLPLLSLEALNDSDLANWTLIRACMNSFFEKYNSNYSSDSFLKAWLLRCNILITKWNWPASVIVTYFYDFFSRKFFYDFEISQMNFEMPNFLQNPGSISAVNDRDPVFHTFLIIAASAVTDVKLSRGSLSRLIGRLTPVLREVNSSETRVKSLSNKYSLLLTLFWYAPYNRGPSIYQIRDTIDTVSASIGECLQSLKALGLLAMFVLRKNLSISVIMKWFDDIVSRFIFEFSSQSCKEESNQFFYEDLFTNILDTFDCIVDRVKDMRRDLVSSVWNDSLSGSLSLCLTRSCGLPRGSIPRLLESVEKFLMLIIEYSNSVSIESSDAVSSNVRLADIIIDGYYGMMSTYIDDELAFPEHILERTIKIWADITSYLVTYRHEHWDTFLSISPKYSWVNFESSVNGRKLKPLWLYYVIRAEPNCYNYDKFLFMEYFIEYITVYEGRYEGIFLVEMLPNFSDILSDELILNGNKLLNRDLFFPIRIEIIEALTEYLELQSLYDSIAERRAVRLMNKLKSCLERNLRHIENASNRTKYFEFMRSIIDFLSTSRLSEKFDQMNSMNSLFYNEKASESEVLFVSQLKRMIKYANTAEGEKNILHLILDSFSASLLSDSGVSFIKNMIEILVNNRNKSVFVPQLCQRLISYFINNFALWFTQLSARKGYIFGFLSVIFDVLFGFIYCGNAVYKNEFSGINRLLSSGLAYINSIISVKSPLDGYQKSFLSAYFKVYLLLLNGINTNYNFLDKISFALITSVPLLLNLIHGHKELETWQSAAASIDILDYDNSYLHAKIPKEIVDFHSKYTYFEGAWYSGKNHRIISLFEQKESEVLDNNILGFFKRCLQNKEILNRIESNEKIISLIQAVAVYGGPGYEDWVVNTTCIADKLERCRPSTVDNFIF